MKSVARNALFGLCLVVLMATPAQSVSIGLFANLDGPQEVPQVFNAMLMGTQATLGGSGSAVMTFDDVSNLLSWTITYSLNTGPATAAHFHGPTANADPAGPGIASPVRVTIPGIAGTSSGTVMNSFDLDALVNPADNPAKLLAGLWYINIHTAAFPSGEIRGQVVTPEPSTLALLALGLIALGIVRSRRRGRPQR